MKQVALKSAAFSDTCTCIKSYLFLINIINFVGLKGFYHILSRTPSSTFYVKCFKYTVFYLMDVLLLCLVTEVPILKISQFNHWY